MDSIVAGGAAVFRSLEEDTLIKKGWQAATHGAYFRIMKDEGSAQFRYWISQNKNDAKKMCTFFNLQNDNKLVKESSKIILDMISINQIIYVPMISKVFDMEESELYDNLTDEDVIRFA